MMLRPLKTWFVANAESILDPFAEHRARQLLGDAFLRYESAAPGLRRDANVGGRLKVHCAALAAAVLHVLIHESVGEHDARALTARVTRAVYEKIAEVPWLAVICDSRRPPPQLGAVLNPIDVACDQLDGCPATDVSSVHAFGAAASERDAVQRDYELAQPLLRTVGPTRAAITIPATRYQRLVGQASVSLRTATKEIR